MTQRTLPPTEPVSIPAIIGGQHALVYQLPECDPHQLVYRQSAQARYDVLWPSMKTWANMCPSCFEESGASLGVGRGQMLVLPHEVQNMVSPPDVPPGCDPQEYMNLEWEADHR